MVFKIAEFAFVASLMSLLIGVRSGGGESPSYSGPRFSKEPPAKLEFVCSKGTTIDCAATGNPPPKVFWTLIDGSQVTSIPGLRDVDVSNLPSGRSRLVLSPFKAENFRPDVHSAVYRCVASNVAGVIHSRNVNLNGVVLQNHEVLVYDSYAIEGNSAVFKCHVPAVLKDYVTVTAWIKNDNLLIEPSTAEVVNGKFAVMPSGELHIHNVTIGESGSRFKCKASHRLTGETQISSSDGQLFVTEARGFIAPKILDTPSTVSLKVDEKAVLACVSQGSPLPVVKWYKKDVDNRLIPVTFDKSIVQTKSGMIIEKSALSDSGTYVCEASSDLGKEVINIKLTIIEPLSVTVKPSVRKSTIGEKIVFECVATGKISSILWLHNGSPLKTAVGSSFVIESVHMADRGIYQCFVKNEVGDLMQATSELQLSEIAPEFLESFEEVTVQPGSLVTMKCVSVGIPLPKITWSIDGMALKGTTNIRITSSVDHEGRAVGTLELARIAIADGGVYSCLASSESGHKTHSARLNVYGPLGVRTVPHVFAVSGRNMSLNCPVYGYPIKSIEWFKDRKQVRVSRRLILVSIGTLMVTDVNRKTDIGIYDCVAHDNSGNQVEAQLNVSVLVAPKIVPFEFQDELLREGMRARLQCVVSDGDLPLSVSWLKDGKPLSPELDVLVRVLDEFSSILTINSITPRHNGKYTCVASNRASTVTHSAELSVNVPPKVVPFSFQDEHLVEGQLARVSCIVSRGDLPIKFVWEKDGVHMGQSTGVGIKSFDDHSSILSISGVTPESNGLYTCVVSNGAGTARHSAQLTVNVPPQWIQEPVDLSVLKGSHVVLHCSVRGFPKPVVTWMKATGAVLNRKFTPLQSSPDLHIFENGSISITNVDTYDEGNYYCEASNGIGTELSKEVELKIQAPPYFKERLNSKKTVGLGNKVELRCFVQGDSPLKITWHKDGKVLQQGQSSKLKIEITSTASDSLSVVTIHKVAREDSANFECLAENAFGTNRSSGSLVIVEPPSAPLEFKTVGVESQMVELSWQASFDGNDAINKYVIQYKLESDSWEESKTMETANGKPTNAIVNRLQPATGYMFRLFAENNQGRSPASHILRVITEEDVPSGAPLNLHVEPVNMETFKVFWKAPEDSLWNGKIQGYYIGYKETDTHGQFLFKTLMTSEPKADDLYVQIGGLKQFTKYSVVVLAYNSEGKGPQTEPVVVMTSEGAPTLPPSLVHCTTLTSESIHVTFAAPPADSISGILRGYKVSYKPIVEEFEDELPMFNVTTETSATLTGLKKFMNYSVHVQAFTRAGDSPLSSIVFCRTLDDVPEAPVDIKAIISSENSVVVSWRSPENPNGIIKSFSVYWRNGNNHKEVDSSKIVSQLHHHEVSRLESGTSYEFWVTGSTLIGEGIPSKVVSQTPSGPKVAAKIVSFEDKIVASWKTDVQLYCHSVGNPEPQRNWQLRGSNVETNDKVQLSADGTLILKDVRVDDAGDYTCHVQNDIGEDKITYTVFILSPPNVVPLLVTAITPNTIELKWTPPMSKMAKIRGNIIGIIGYTMKMKPNDGVWKEISLKPEESYYKINSLDCGTQYEVSMLAHNKIGSSVPSEILVLSTNGSVPISPSNSDLIEETSSSVSLYLNTWKNNGCPIQSYVVEYAPKSSNEWTLVSKSVKPEQRRLVIPNLKSATRYGLRMTARNSAGSTVAKYEFATLTTSGGTISPDVQGDAPYGRVDSLMTQLNFYLVVPVICTAIILLAIMGVAYMCVKLKKTDRRNREVNQRLSAAALYELKRGDSSESFNYMKRGSVCRPGSSAKHAPNDITPYATLQLNHHGNQMNTLGRQCSAPPLPPPRFDGFGCGHHIMDPHFFPQPGPSFMPGNQDQMVETKFIFPANQMGESPVAAVNSFPPGYQIEIKK